ncbi:Uncharacterized protein GBIM_04119 [Gryllus bimaculatus]|nr:Uncharacterized protein GBIM_04119 [Gryllus bimaculatus]
MQGLWGYESIVDSPERLQFQMISFTLDPQWCGLLFSIYCRHEKTSVLGPDTFSTCTLTGPPLDADWIAFAGSIGVEICRLSSSWALIFETVKASGVILLLGVGSLVCYKLYHYYWPGSRSRLNSPNSSPPHSRYGENLILYHVRDDNQLVEDLDDEDISSIEGRYFGPAPVPSKSSLQHGIDVANFLRKSRFFSIIPSASHFKWHCDWDQNINPWNNCALEESGFLEWDNNINCSRQPPRDWSEGRETIASFSEQSTPMSDVPNSEAISPMSNFPISTSNVTENVGPKVNIFEYAMREWQGHTKKAETILKGYAEIPSLLGVQYLRSIRGDNYCGVRAALFQVLSKGLPLPSGSTVYDYLSNACRMGNSKWLQNWNFAGRLPYESSNVLHGMKSCLESLDNMVSVLSSSEDRQQTLVALLNRNPSLDLHLMEAAKLHMLMCAMELYEASSAGLDVPLFAMLMFARDTSETPRDLMNNHLKNVGNTGGLEQVEMFLLGYALQVTLRVVRPAAHGTEDFICCYPDWNLGVWPEVILIAEDDRHYNVLVVQKFGLTWLTILRGELILLNDWIEYIGTEIIFLVLSFFIQITCDIPIETN